MAKQPPVAWMLFWLLGALLLIVILTAAGGIWLAWKAVVFPFNLFVSWKSASLLADYEARLSAVVARINELSRELPNSDPQASEVTRSDDSVTLDHAGKMYYFCSRGCSWEFRESPNRFLGEAATRERP